MSFSDDSNLWDDVSGVRREIRLAEPPLVSIRGKRAERGTAGGRHRGTAGESDRRWIPRRHRRGAVDGLRRDGVREDGVHLQRLHHRREMDRYRCPLHRQR